MNLNGKLTKNWRGQTGGQAKIWGGHGPPRPPLELSLPILFSLNPILFSVSPSVLSCSMLGLGLGHLQQRKRWRALKRGFPTRSTLNTSSMGSSVCTRSDGLSKPFKKCHNGEGHVKAPVILTSTTYSETSCQGKTTSIFEVNCWVKFCVAHRFSALGKMFALSGKFNDWCIHVRKRLSLTSGSTLQVA